MSECPKADRLVNHALEHAWAADLDERTPNLVNVVLSSSWKHPDTSEGWQWGATVAYFRTGPTRWTLGHLDGKANRVVAGVAIHTDGTEVEFWLNSIKALEDAIVEPEPLVRLLEDGRRK